ncbi:hypothetical protein OJF2_72760 [Aquisphaera giovannonii]|uniref:Uncharacterized protein n=2 Tax=Aquisphaera giovannonii TaxID=406548 RepID=A0A5B9WFK3_9BACT|nr:hypothetical protein OJF2_72760 [Aquisphaera giovannonii]
MIPVPVAGRVSGALRGLIDSRLDTIDRMLLGRLPRSERLDIVREVESQVYELLEERAEQGGGELCREDVLAVLARLDPPEAYLLVAEDGEETPAMRLARSPRGERPRPAAGRPPDPADGRLARTSGILGIVGLVFSLLQFPLIEVVGDLFRVPEAIVYGVWFVLTAAVFVLGTLGIVLAGRAGLRRPWAVAGLILGILDVLASLVLAAFGISGG